MVRVRWHVSTVAKISVSSPMPSIHLVLGELVSLFSSVRLLELVSCLFPSYLISICVRNQWVLFLLILFTSDAVIFNCCCVSMHFFGTFLYPRFYEIFNIFRQHQFSKAIIFIMLAFFNVQVSAPYIVTGKTSASISLTFVSIVTSFPFHILSNPTTAALPKATLFFISSSQSPFSVIIEPRRLKLEATSSSSLPRLNACRFVVDIIFVFFMFKNKPASSAASSHCQSQRSSVGP